MMNSTVSLRPQLSPGEEASFGKYRLLRELATGGMARIYLATIDGPGGFVKPCVVKKILPSFVRHADFNNMFVNEAKVAALLNHPNIVQAFDFGQVGDEYFLALEFVEGASLASVIREARRKRIRPSLNQCVQIGISLCEALAYAHSAVGQDGVPLKLVHRDVTPGNVLISSAGGVKLTDFGIVKSALSSATSSPEVLKGKLAYISPEQARLEVLDGRSDIFSLALVLYEFATFTRPLARPTMGESMSAASRADIPPPSKLGPFPEDLEYILMRALARDREQRYPSAKAMQADLEAFRAEQHWTSATNELAALLETLYPEGPPTSPRALQRPSNVIEASFVGSGELVSGGDVFGSFLPSFGTAGHWREIAFAVAVGLAASAAIWLFALP